MLNETRYRNQIFHCQYSSIRARMSRNMTSSKLFVSNNVHSKKQDTVYRTKPKTVRKKMIGKID